MTKSMMTVLYFSLAKAKLFKLLPLKDSTLNPTSGHMFGDDNGQVVLDIVSAR